MFLVFFLFSSLLGSFNQALPISERTPPSVLDVETNNRSIFNILWSCIVTTFLCAWVSIHPSVRRYKHGQYRPLKNFGARFFTLCLAVIGPELIVGWASMDYFAARQIRNKYKKKGWTMAHGFLIEMGGFALCKSGHHSKMKVDNKNLEDRYIKTLTSETFGELLKNSSIEFPTITEAEIQDRSKGDVVAKLLAAIQTSWFVLQCIVRHQQGLAITELELSTLSLATLNVIVLWLWKDKPLDVTVQVPVYQKSDAGVHLPECQESEGATGDEEADKQQVSTGNVGGSNILMRWYDKWIVDLQDERRKGYEIYGVGKKTIELDRIPLWKPFQIVVFQMVVDFTTSIKELRGKDWLVGLPMIVVKPLFYLGLLLIGALCTPAALLELYAIQIVTKVGPLDKYVARLFNVVSTGDGQNDFLVYLKLFPKEDNYSIPALLIGMNAGLIFGGLHCFAWNYIFPTTAERTLWRVMSLTITVIPLITQLTAIPLLVKKNLFVSYQAATEQRHDYVLGSPIFLYVFVSLQPLYLVLYVVARLSIIVLALAALRQQPASAFVTVRWTKLLHS